MPARNEIQNEILAAKSLAQDNVRRKYIKELSDYTKRDTIIYMTAYTTGKMPVPAIPAGLNSLPEALPGLIYE